MRNSLTLLLMTALLLAACAPAASPTPSPVPSIASSTPQPPTATPHPSASATSAPPSATPLPPTASATATPEPSPTIELALTPTYTPVSGYYRNKAALLKLENNSGQEVSIILNGFIYEGTSYYEVTFDRTDYKLENVPLGDYRFTATIGDSGPYYGAFSITNTDKHTLIFHTDKVTFHGP